MFHGHGRSWNKAECLWSGPENGEARQKLRASVRKEQAGSRFLNFRLIIWILPAIIYLIVFNIDSFTFHLSPSLLKSQV